MSVFAKAWEKMKVQIEDKTSWGKLEIKNLMFDCLSKAATEEDEKEDMYNDFNLLLKRCRICGASGINLLIMYCRERGTTYELD